MFGMMLVIMMLRLRWWNLIFFLILLEIFIELEILLVILVDGWLGVGVVILVIIVGLFVGILE